LKAARRDATDVNVIYIHEEAAVESFAAKLDSFGKPAWIALVILAFWFWWPLGLAALAFLIGSGRMGCWNRGGPGRWYRPQSGRRSGCGWGRSWASTASSGNSAFDEYRAETLRRLEEEQREFAAYLERLRKARDKAEFDQFMAERGGRRSDFGVNTV
jgi:hypothetical protein